jgi:hypothetical protein
MRSGAVALLRLVCTIPAWSQQRRFNLGARGWCYVLLSSAAALLQLVSAVEGLLSVHFCCCAGCESCCSLCVCVTCMQWYSSDDVVALTGVELLSIVGCVQAVYGCSCSNPRDAVILVLNCCHFEPSPL